MIILLSFFYCVDVNTFHRFCVSTAVFFHFKMWRQLGLVSLLHIGVLLKRLTQTQIDHFTIDDKDSMMIIVSIFMIIVVIIIILNSRNWEWRIGYWQSDCYHSIERQKLTVLLPQLWHHSGEIFFFKFK